jgi:mannosyltransferase
VTHHESLSVNFALTGPGDTARRSSPPVRLLKGVLVQQLEAPTVLTTGTLDPPLAETTPHSERTFDRRGLGRRFGPELAVCLVAGVVFAWRVGAPGPWRDEAATLVIADRTLPQMLSLTRSIDLVHLAYYLCVHALMELRPTALLSEGLPEIRMIGVVACALTAGVLVRIGRQLDSLPVGVTAGLIFALGPLSSRYAQEARPYAIVIFTCTFATYALLRACRRPWLRRRWALYAATVAVCGLFNVLSLFLLAVHATFLLWQAPKVIWRRWATATAGAVALLSPFILATVRQRGQISWLAATDLANLRDFFTVEYESLPLPLLVLAVGLIAPRAARWVPALHRAHRSALVLGAAWSIVPPVAMWLVSRQVPIFDWRYAVFTLPGTALLLASLARVAPPLGAGIPLVVVALVGWPMQMTYRDPAVGHSEDLRGATAFIAAHTNPGDGVLFLPGHMRLVAELYPERFRGLDDLALSRDAIASSTISGVEVSGADLPSALEGHRRVWVLAGPFGIAETWTDTDRAKVEELLRSYRIVQQRSVLKFTVFLYVAARGEPGLPERPLTRAPGTWY